MEATRIKYRCESISWIMHYNSQHHCILDRSAFLSTEDKNSRIFKGLVSDTFHLGEKHSKVMCVVEARETRSTAGHFTAK